MNLQMIVNILGWLLIFDGAFMLVPTVTGIIYGEKEALAFLPVIGACVLLWFLMTHKKPASKNLYAREGYVIVALSWVIMSLFGSIPFVLAGSIPNYIDALLRPFRASPPRELPY